MSRQSKLLIIFVLFLVASATIVIYRVDSLNIVTTGFLFGMLFYLPPVLALIWIIRRIRRSRRDGSVRVVSVKLRTFADRLSAGTSLG